MTDPALHIRPVTPADYPALATLHNAYYGIGWPMTAATLEAFDQVTEGGELPPRLAHRWVAEVDGDLAALALVRWTRIPDPHRYALNFVLADGWRDSPAAPTIRQGCLAAMQAWIAQQPAEFVAHELRSHGRGDHPADLDFWRAQGFVETLREQDSLLDTAAFDPAPFRDLLAQLTAQGIEIRAFSQLPPGPATEQALYALEQELNRDVPGWVIDPTYTFDQWRIMRFAAPEFRPDAYFVAVQNGAPVGLSYLTGISTRPWLHQRLTGVRRTHRRQGIATALKVWGIEYARARGFTRIITSNAVGNEAMLGLNHRLGFEPQPVWVHFKLPLPAQE